MKIFSGSPNLPLTKIVAEKLELKLSELEINIFPDGEKRVRVVDDVVEEDVVLIQSTAMPVDSNYMELFLTLDCLKRSGAKSITLVAPYLGYQRQDHVFRSGEDAAFEMISQILEKLRIDKLITFDLHSIKLPEFFQIPVVHLSALELFAKHIEKGSVLVTPDMGGIRRIKILSELTGLPYAVIEKNRDLVTGKVSSDKIEGDVKGKDVTIVDDMISTGETIKAAAELLRQKGSGKVSVFATHAVFSGDVDKILSESKVEKIYVTDTIEIPEEKHFDNLEVLSVAKMISDELK